MNLFNFFIHLGKIITSLVKSYSYHCKVDLSSIIFGCRGSREEPCLILVDRIITAEVIGRFMKKVASLCHFTVSYFTGTNTSVDGLALKIQKERLELFCSGEVYDLSYCRKGID